MDKILPSPEMRACFAADAQSTLRKIQELLPTLDRVIPDFSQIQPLSDTLHSLRGAAGLMGGQALCAFLADLERLLEIAASFQFGAVNRARQIFHLIQEVLPRLPPRSEETCPARWKPSA